MFSPCRFSFCLFPLFLLPSAFSFVYSYILLSGKSLDAANLSF